MYPGRAFSLPTMIGRINRTLNFANQVIPLYMKAKPMIKNAQDAFKVAKEFMNKNQKQPIKQNIPQKEKIIPNNKPVFFQ